MNPNSDAAIGSGISLPVVPVPTPGVPDLGQSSLVGSPSSAKANASETITILATLRDGFGIPVMGQSVTLSVSPSGPTIMQPAVATNSLGMVTGSLTSSVAGTFTVTAQTGSGFSITQSVVFTPALVSPTYSTISGSATTVADGVATATVTITLRDPTNVPVNGVTPTFSATDGGSTNTYGVCSLSDASGVSTCTLRSRKAETKVLSLTSPTTKVGDSINFIAGPVLGTHSSLQVSPASLTANGSSQAQITLTARDQYDNPVSGIGVAFAVSGTGNTIGQPGSGTSAAGVAIGTVSSTVAGVKTVSLVGAPTELAGLTASISFVPGAASASTSTIGVSAGTQTASSGSSAVTITVTLRDAQGNAVPSTALTLQVSGSGNALSASNLTTNASGVATATLSSTKAEPKSITLAGLAGVAGAVSFTPAAASATTSTLVASPILNVPADLASSSQITVTLRDAFNNPIPSQVLTVGVSGGSGNQLSSVPNTNASGVSSFTLSSSSTGTKTISLSSPSGLGALSATVGFVAPTTPINPPDAAHSSIVVSTASGIVADGVGSTTVTVTLHDASGNPVVNQGLTIACSGTSNTLGAVSGSTNASGQWSTTLTSTKAETKTITVAAPSGLSSLSATATFVAGPPSSALSTLSASPSSGVVANGSSASTLTLTLRDAQGNVIPSSAVVLSTSGGTLGSASGRTNGSGVFTTNLTSTSTGSKTVSITTPSGFGSLQASVFFVAGAVDATTSSFTLSSAGPITADGSSSVTLTAILRDANSNPVFGQTVAFSATGSGNTITQPGSTTDGTGTATGSIRSTVAELKALTLTSPAGLAVPPLTRSLSFVAGAPASATSTLVASRTSGILADGLDATTITLTIKDAQGNPVVGQAVTLAASGTGNTFTQGAASTDSQGQITATLASTSSGTKSVTVSSPSGLSALSASVAFTCAGADDTNSTLTTSVASVTADGTSTTTATVTVRDAAATPNVCAGIAVTLDVTGLGNTVTPVTGTTNASGVFTATLKSTVAETKTVSIADPVGLSASQDVSFVAGAASALTSTISAYPSSGIAASTGGVVKAAVNIVLKDAQGNAISGASPLFSATGSNNTFTAPGVTNSSGASAGGIGTSTAETKTLSITNPTGLTSVTSTVTFIVSTVDSAKSSIAVSPATVPVGGTSTITVTFKNASNAAVVGETPVLNVTNSGGDNVLSACGATNASGVSTCTVSSRTAETKAVSLISPVNLTGPTIQFTRDLEVPIEFLDTGIQGLSSQTDWLVSQTAIDPTKYDGTLSYSFEAVCSNTGASGVAVSLMYGTNSTASTLTIPGGTSTLTRIANSSVALSPSAATYRIRTAAVSSGTAQCSAARLVIRQVGATKTRMYIPLTGRSASFFATTAPTGTPATTAGYIASTSSNSYSQPSSSVSFFNRMSWDPANWSGVSGLELEIVGSSASSSRAARGKLVTGSGLTQVAVATTASGTAPVLATATATLPSTSTSTYYQVTFSSSRNSTTAYLYRAGMWITMSALKKGEVYYRVGRAETVTATSGSPAIFNGLRIPINLGYTTSSTLYTQLVGASSSGSGTLSFLTGGVNNSGTSGTSVSDLTWTGTKSIVTSASSVSFTDGDQLFTSAYQTSGSSVTLSNACAIVRFD